MKTRLHVALLIPYIAVLLGTSTLAHAQYAVSGSVWENGTTTNVPTQGSSIYSTTPTATFTVTNTSVGSLLNFYSASDNGLSAFLANGSGGPNGDTLTYQTGGGAGGDNINNDLFQFNGTTTLSNGSYNFAHDDGLILYLTGTVCPTTRSLMPQVQPRQPIRPSPFAPQVATRRPAPTPLASTMPK